MTAVDAQGDAISRKDSYVVIDEPPFLAGELRTIVAWVPTANAPDAVRVAVTGVR